MDMDKNRKSKAKCLVCEKKQSMCNSSYIFKPPFESKFISQFIDKYPTE